MVGPGHAVPVGFCRDRTSGAPTEEICCKDLAHAVAEAVKSDICWAYTGRLETQATVDPAILRRNSFFFKESAGFASDLQLMRRGPPALSRIITSL